MLEESGRYAKSLRVTRAELRAERLAEVSRRAGTESMRVSAEFYE
jgi:hypothetical protein